MTQSQSQGSEPRSYFPTNKASADSEKIEHVSERYKEKDETHITVFIRFHIGD